MSDTAGPSEGGSGSSPGKEILTVSIEDELRQSYLDYAMSVIVGRALPDIRDGLKPVHRRVLFAMSELNNTWNRGYVKSARVVGEVIGKYHPHGDSAVYETIVRMAQEFSMRHLLVDGQGNFGSIDGDSAAAMRYTEIRMARMASDLLEDLDKETVNFVPNYDETLSMPVVLPTRVPNLLVNGSSGIAVGMATNIPPHNLAEVVRACLALIDDPSLGVDDLMEHVTGPDFPTGGIINGRAGILQAYRTGRGRIYVRAKAEVISNDKTHRDTILIHEIPFQLNKAKLIEKIADLVKEKRLEGISEIRDESDKDGLRVVIELRRDVSGDVVLNNLYTQTQLQTVFGINCVALLDGQPKVVNLHDMISQFLLHRREVVTRRSIYLLRKARERGHLLEGQAVALSNIDEVVELIKASSTPADARTALLSRGWQSETVSAMLARTGADACRPDELDAQYGFRDGAYWLSPAQAQSILEMRLHRLTALEQDKLRDEYSGILETIADLLEILASAERLMAVIREELVEIGARYDEPRRTEIIESTMDLTVEDLIPVEDMVVTISHGGYAKTQPLDAYQAQKRGGMGKASTALKDEDFIEHLLVASSHDTLLTFSNKGKVYWIRVFQVPQGSRGSRGRPLVNLLPLAPDERITAMLPISEYPEDRYVFMATANGTVKKTDLSQFSKPRSVGLIALELEDDNTLVGAALTEGDSDVLLFASNGKAVRFRETNVRAMGRTARGVKGITMGKDDSVISLLIPAEGGQVLTGSANGYGKRTAVAEFPTKTRGTQGVIAMAASERNGALVAAVQVFAGDEVMLISDQGTLVRTGADQVSLLSRNTQGVRLIRTKEAEHLITVARIAEADSNPAAGEADGEADADTNTDTNTDADTDSSEDQT